MIKKLKENLTLAINYNYDVYVGGEIERKTDFKVRC